MQPFGKEKESYWSCILVLTHLAKNALEALPMAVNLRSFLDCLNARGCDNLPHDLDCVCVSKMGL